MKKLLITIGFFVTLGASAQVKKMTSEDLLTGKLESWIEVTDTVTHKVKRYDYPKNPGIHPAPQVQLPGLNFFNATPADRSPLFFNDYSFELKPTMDIGAATIDSVFKKRANYPAVLEAFGWEDIIYHPHNSERADSVFAKRKKIN